MKAQRDRERESENEIERWEKEMGEREWERKR